MWQLPFAFRSPPKCAVARTNFKRAKTLRNYRTEVPDSSRGTAKLLLSSGNDRPPGKVLANRLNLSLRSESTRNANANAELRRWDVPPGRSLSASVGHRRTDVRVSAEAALPWCMEASSPPGVHFHGCCCGITTKDCFLGRAVVCSGELRPPATGERSGAGGGSGQWGRGGRGQWGRGLGSLAQASISQVAHKNIVPW